MSSCEEPRSMGMDTDCALARAVLVHAALLSRMEVVHLWRLRVYTVFNLWSHVPCVAITHAFKSLSRPRDTSLNARESFQTRGVG